MGAAELGIGLAAVARPAYITSGRAQDLGTSRDVPELERRTWAVLDAAVACGVRYVDVARSYGLAEQFLARWLAAPTEADVAVGSKWGYRYVGAWRTDAEVHEVKDHSLAAFLEQRDETLRLLGAHLRAYHVHSATLETGVLDDVALHRAMAGLRERGVRLGVSTSGPEQATAVRRAMEVVVDGEPLFTSVQTTWNPLETSAGEALAEAAQAGAQVIVKEALANGRLAPGGEDGTPGVTRMRALAQAEGLPVDVLALAAALHQPWATYVLSGGVTAEQVRSNGSAAGVRLGPEVLDALRRLAEPPRAYWSARSQRPWS